MIDTLIAWVLLPLGVVLGLAISRRNSSGTPEQREEQRGSMGAATPTDFRTITSSDSETVELQLTLGSLFRKRGELDRAIQLHQAVLAKSSLSPTDTAAAELELAQDFLRAGVMDRAETLLQGLVSRGEHLASALELLLDLHEQGRDWLQAIATATRLQAVRGSSEALRIAHHHCELADNARHAGEFDVADQQARKALDVDPDCARANLLLAAIAEAAKDWPVAIKAYARAVDQDRRYLSDVLGPLKRCFSEAGDEASNNAWAQFLDDAEADHPGSMSVALARAETLVEQGGDARAYLAARIEKSPNLDGLLAWVETATPDDEAATRLIAVFRKKLQSRPRYACSSCGLKPGVLFWQCPSCKEWATIAPAKEDL